MSAFADMFIELGRPLLTEHHAQAATYYATGGASGSAVDVIFQDQPALEVHVGDERSDQAEATIVVSTAALSPAKGGRFKIGSDYWQITAAPLEELGWAICSCRRIVFDGIGERVQS